MEIHNADETRHVLRFGIVVGRPCIDMFCGGMRELDSLAPRSLCQPLVVHKTIWAAAVNNIGRRAHAIRSD